jgi:hypothetical protein
VRNAGSNTRGRAWGIYGRAGSGKTTLVASFPSPVLLINVRDDGDDSIAGGNKVKVRDIEEFEDFEDTYWWIKQNPKVYKTIAIDTTTQLQQLLVEEVSAKKNLKGKNAGDWGTMTKGDWGDVAAAMKTWITHYAELKKLGIEVVFIAQDRVFNVDEEDSSEGMIDPEVGPRLSPSVMSHLCAAVDVIGNTFVRERIETKKVDGKTRRTKHIEYCLRLGPSSAYITKIRKPKSVRLPDFVVDPTFEDILDIIEGE